LRSAERHNFVLILADDLGYNGTSVFGGWIRTPNLERMAAEGMRFTDFHSSGTVCSPTRAGLVTGRYQQRAGIPGVVLANPKAPVHYTGLQDSEITFAEVLKRAGYATGLMGKWHLGYLPQYNPTRHGFDEFHGYVSGNVDYISHYDLAGNYDWWDGTKLVVEEGYTTHLITRHALDFSRRHKDQPFCLYIAHEAVHSPFQGPNSQILRGPRKGKRTDAVELSKREAYVQMMTEMDRGVGQVLDTLRRLGLAHKTFVFFFSDNGHAANAPAGPPDYQFPLRGHKGQEWEGGHRVPAIAWWPGRIPPGTVNRGLWITLDVMPTLLELSGTRVPEGHRLDGVSMVDGLLRGEQPQRRQLFWNGVAMRDGPWKLVLGRDGGLFNLQEDPKEQRDLSGQYPERVERMKAAIERWKRDVEATATPQPPPPPALQRAVPVRRKPPAGRASERARQRGR